MGWVVTSWRAVPLAGTWQAEGWGPRSMGLLAGQDNALWPHMLLAPGMSVGQPPQINREKTYLPRQG